MVFPSLDVARARCRVDGFVGFEIVPPCTPVSEGSKDYLQVLDFPISGEGLDRLPVDSENPYGAIACHIEKQDLDYGTLLRLADACYGCRCIDGLCRVACWKLEEGREAARGR